MPSSDAFATDVAVVVPNCARSASRGIMLWTSPESVKPSTSGHQVSQIMAKASLKPIANQWMNAGAAPTIS
ncbi:MAG TPA: hypothetical protein VIJ40_00530 [Acidimicrobiales bacterium]